LDQTDLAGNTNNSNFKESIFFAGKRIASRDFSNNVYYYFSDHLGTARIVASSSGSVLDDSDFYPFGTERPILSSSGNPYKFTGKERDAESGLDNFGLRYLTSSMGRFMSPDSIANDWELANPQTWNRYAYARNNPLIYVDPDGAAVELICTGGNADQCAAQRQKELEAIQASLGNKDAASRLYININEVKDGDNTRYFVGIKGDVGDFMKLGDTSHDLANLVQDKQVVEFGLTKSDLSQWGGAVTYAPGEAPGGTNQNVRVLVNTEQAVDLASTILERTVLGAVRIAAKTNAHLGEYAI
jgi:RHS repeat-associated protein